MLKRNIVLMSAVLLGMAVPSAAQATKSRFSVGNDARGRQARSAHLSPVRAIAASTRTLTRQGSRQTLRGSSSSRRRYGATAAVRFGLSLGAPRYRTERIWVAGCERRVWVPARYEYRCVGSFGALRRVLVRSGHYHTDRDPGRWEYRRVRVCGDGYRSNNVHLSYFH
jgi:hypothetical protein